MASMAMRTLGGALLGLMMAAAPGFAQQRQAAPAPAAATPSPDRTTAQYGDWTVSCGVPQGGSQRVCEMSHTVLDTNQQTVGAIAFGRPGKDQPMKMVVQVAANVRVAQPLKLSLDADVNLPFTLCNQRVCAVEQDVRDDALPRRFRSRSADQPGRLTWRDAGGTEVTFPFSVRGFSAAWEALGREGG